MVPRVLYQHCECLGATGDNIFCPCIDIDNAVHDSMITLSVLLDLHQFPPCARASERYKSLEICFWTLRITKNNPGDVSINLLSLHGALGRDITAPFMLPRIVWTVFEMIFDHVLRRKKSTRSRSSDGLEQRSVAQKIENNLFFRKVLGPEAVSPLFQNPCQQLYDSSGTCVSV